ncbi:MAG: hypothetical protein ABR598_02310 [Candidatus Dormibacteria bacterium]
MVTLLALVLTLSGCGSAGQVLSMATVTSDLVFGVPVVAKPHQQPGSRQPQPPAAFSNALPRLLESLFAPPEQLVPSDRFRTQSAPAKNCPPASPKAVPRDPPPFSATVPPAPGTFRWVEQVTQNTAAGKVVSGSFPTHYITNVVHSPDEPQDLATQLRTGNHVVHVWTFDEVLPGAYRGKTIQIIQSYLVRSPDAFYDSLDPKGQGVLISKIQYKDLTGADVRPPFAPPVSQQLLLYPLPIILGTGNAQNGTTGHNLIQGNSVDPTTGESYAYTITTGNKEEKIDACGDLILGFPADIAITYNSGSANLPDPPSTAQATWHVVGATQYGGKLIRMDIKNLDSSGQNVTDERDDFVGQLDPGPLPPNLKP